MDELDLHTIRVFLTESKRLSQVARRALSADGVEQFNILASSLRKRAEATLEHVIRRKADRPFELAQEIISELL